MLFCLCGDLTLWSSFLLDSFIFRVGEVVCIYVSKYLVVEMECIAFKVSLADVMQEEVFSRLVKGDLPAKVDCFPSSLGSSRMTIFFKTHAQSFSSCT